MARCSNNIVLQKIGQRKVDNQQEIDFSVRRPLPACRRIRTDHTVGAAPIFSRMLRPKNRFECGADGCSTTGTASLAANGTALYYLKADATEFSSGVITFYVKPEAYPDTITVTISDAQALTNADVYTNTLTATMATDDGFVPVMINLKETPSSTSGDGWTASNAGAYIQISTSGAAGISSITVLDSILDFQTNATVKIGCITTAGGSMDLSIIEQTCRQAELDDSISQLSFPITGRLMTPNWYMLSPMYQKGGETEGFRLVTVEKSVEEYSVGNTIYGRVFIADAHDTECRFWAAQIADSCDPYDAQLQELTIPVYTDVPSGYFQIIRDSEGVSVLFSAEMIGTKVLIEYPQAAEVEETIFGTDDLNEVVTSMTVPFGYTGSGTTAVDNRLHNGVSELHIFDYVLVTGFPHTISNSDQDVSFTITVMKVDGKFFRVHKYI